MTWKEAFQIIVSLLAMLFGHLLPWIIKGEPMGETPDDLIIRVMAIGAAFFVELVIWLFLGNWFIYRGWQRYQWRTLLYGVFASIAALVFNSAALAFIGFMFKFVAALEKGKPH